MRKQFLALAGVIVYALHNYAGYVRDAAVQLTSQPVSPKRHVVVPPVFCTRLLASITRLSSVVITP